MNSSTSYHSTEPNLFQFHFNSTPSFQSNQNPEDPRHSSHQHPPQPIFTNFDSHLNFSQNPITFSSPQLKPTQSPLSISRKRFKTIESNNKPLIMPMLVLNEKEKSESENPTEKDDDDEEDEESDSEELSNQGSESVNQKRGKYKIYSDSERQTIINFMMKHGMQKTLEIFAGSEHKLTKRKLKSWIDNQHKIKGIKGRKTNDPNRDQNLYDWCMAFQKDNGRAPTRKEATKKALDLSEDPSFQASKGWLDKFSRKYNMEFTPLKIIPIKNKKINGLSQDSDSSSTLSKSDSSPMEAISPLSQAVLALARHQGQEFKMKPLMTFESYVTTQQSLQAEYEAPATQTNSFFNFSGSTQDNQDEGMMGYEMKTSIPTMESIQYEPAPVNNGVNYNYEYSLDPVNYQFETKMEYPTYDQEPSYLTNNQMGNNDISGFLNAKANWENVGYMNEQMRLEYPY